MKQMSRETSEEIKDRLDAVLSDYIDENDCICTTRFALQQAINRIIDQYVMR